MTPHPQTYVSQKAAHNARTKEHGSASTTEVRYCRRCRGFHVYEAGSFRKQVPSEGKFLNYDYDKRTAYNTVWITLLHHRAVGRKKI